MGVKCRKTAEYFVSLFWCHKKCRLSLSLKVVRGPLKLCLDRVAVFHRLDHFAHSFNATVLSSPPKQRLERIPIFSCLDRNAQCFDATPLKRAPQPANKDCCPELLNIVTFMQQKIAHMSYLGHEGDNLLWSLKPMVLMSAPIMANRRLLVPGLIVAAIGIVAVFFILSAPHSNPPVTTNQSDGASLYAQYCGVCHRSLTATNVQGRTPENIQQAIVIFPQMKGLSGLTPQQVELISEALLNGK